MTKQAGSKPLRQSHQLPEHLSPLEPTKQVPHNRGLTVRQLCAALRMGPIRKYTPKTGIDLLWSNMLDTIDTDQWVNWHDPIYRARPPLPWEKRGQRRKKN